MCAFICCATKCHSLRLLQYSKTLKLKSKVTIFNSSRAMSALLQLLFAASLNICTRALRARPNILFVLLDDLGLLCANKWSIAWLLAMATIPNLNEPLAVYIGNLGIYRKCDGPCTFRVSIIADVVIPNHFPIDYCPNQVACQPLTITRDFGKRNYRLELKANSFLWTPQCRETT